MLFSVPLSLFALRKGWAGWIIALSFGAAVGALIGDGKLHPHDVDSRIVFGLIGLLYAGIYWLLLRIFNPESFSWPGDTDT